jgi:hypothetical protein
VLIICIKRSDAILTIGHPIIKKIKLEKGEEMQHQQSNCSCVTCTRKKIKKRMDVVLPSPNSAQFVALGTVQSIDAAAIGFDGQPLSDSVEVLVNIVYKTTTKLPRPRHEWLTKMGSAQAECIPWPMKHISSFMNRNFEMLCY